MPSWLTTGIVLSSVVFIKSSAAISIFYHFTTGLALCSFALVGAAFFKKALLSGIILTVITVVLVVIPQLLAPEKQTPATVFTLSLIFPSTIPISSRVWRDGNTWIGRRTSRNQLRKVLGSCMAWCFGSLDLFMDIDLCIPCACPRRRTNSFQHRITESDNSFQRQPFDFGGPTQRIQQSLQAALARTHFEEKKPRRACSQRAQPRCS